MRLDWLEALGGCRSAKCSSAGICVQFGAFPAMPRPRSRARMCPGARLPGLALVRGPHSAVPRRRGPMHLPVRSAMPVRIVSVPRLTEPGWVALAASPDRP